MLSVKGPTPKEPCMIGVAPLYEIRSNTLKNRVSGLTPPVEVIVPVNVAPVVVIEVTESVVAVGGVPPTQLRVVKVASAPYVVPAKFVAKGRKWYSVLHTRPVWNSLKVATAVSGADNVNVDPYVNEVP